MPWVLEQIYRLNGWQSGNPYKLLIPCDFTNWADYMEGNILVLVLLGLGLLGLLFGAIGLRIEMDKRN